MECKNCRCPLNKEYRCDNDVVLSGKAPCHGKDRISNPVVAMPNQIRYGKAVE